MTGSTQKTESDRRSQLDRILCKPVKPAVRERQMALFLEALLEHCGMVSHATEAMQEAGTLEVRPALFYSWKNQYPEFAAAWAEAVDIGADKLEAVAKQRAVEGVQKPVTFQGEITATYTEYSDGLLQFLLKGAKPDKYNRQALQLSGPAGGPIQIQRVERVIVDPAASLADGDDKDEA